MKKRELNYCEIKVVGERKIGNRKKLVPFEHIHTTSVPGENLKELMELINNGYANLTRRISEHLNLKPTDTFKIVDHKILFNQGKTNYEL